MAYFGETEFRVCTIKRILYPTGLNRKALPNEVACKMLEKLDRLEATLPMTTVEVDVAGNVIEQDPEKRMIEDLNYWASLAPRPRKIHDLSKKL